MGGYLIPVVNGVAYGLLLFVVAAGLTLAFGAGGVLNLAHGSFYALGAYAAAVLTDGSWAGFALAVAIGAAAGAAAGGLLSVGLASLAVTSGARGQVTAPDGTAGRGHLAQALLTFGVALALGAVLVLAFGPDELRPAVPAVLDQPVRIGGRAFPGYRLAVIGVAALLAVAGWLVLARTRAGARVRAMAADPQMLAGCGIDPRRVLAGVLATGGALAGFAGAVGAPVLGAGPRTGELVLLLSLIVVVLGGLGSVPGAFLAAIAVGQVQSVGVVLLPELAPYLLFAAMALVLLVRYRPVLLPAAGTAGAAGASGAAGSPP